ncbi:MAG: hypothetical protein Kow00108_16750 [Calditrichia bacterium]
MIILYIAYIGLLQVITIRFSSHQLTEIIGKKYIYKIYIEHPGNPPKSQPAKRTSKAITGLKRLNLRRVAPTEELKNKSKGKILGTETIIVNPYESTIENLLGDLETAMFGEKMVPDLDEVLANVRRYRKEGPFDPSVDITALPEEKLALERTYSPEIDTSRIENRMFYVQAPRNPMEVSQVIKSNEPVIQYCFRKFKYEMNRKYSIQVEFNIDHTGAVIPGSVKVIRTNITNPKLIKCITRAIARWKNFGEIEMTDYVYRVKQKWVF